MPDPLDFPIHSAAKGNLFTGTIGVQNQAFPSLNPDLDHGFPDVFGQNI